MTRVNPLGCMDLSNGCVLLTRQLRPFASTVVVLPGAVHASEGQTLSAWRDLAAEAGARRGGMVNVYVCGDHPTVVTRAVSVGP
jgi:hypothetical protein